MSTRSIFKVATVLLSAVASPVVGQLTTACNPLNATCPADPALGTTHTFYFNATPPTGTFNTTAGTVGYNFDTGAAFTINKKGESPTLISNFYFFFGRTEVHLKAAPGTGVISSIVWSSDVLDEVDWEFMGGNTTHVSTNYFGKGVPDFHNAQYHPVNGGVQADYHNYTCVWTKDQLEWYIDSQHTRTLLAKDANNTLYYPQTPMKLSLGIWAGGDPDQPKGTIEWAGGITDYAEPYTMYVKSALVQDYSTGKEYSYGDNSGTWESIKIASGNSTAVENINREPEKSLSEKWNDLPSSTKNGVYAAAGGVGAIAFIALVVFGLRQRRRGKQEAALAAQRQEQERVELERFKREGRDPDALAFDGTEYKGAMATAAYAVPDSPPGSSAGPPEKAWDPTGPGAATAAMPLLRDDAMSQRVGGPAPSSVGPQRNNSFPSPIHTQSPGQSPQIPAPTPISPVNRTFSPSNASMRMGSPGPQAGGYGSPRINSPTSPRPGYGR
ncbi:glycoside hydrolase family 16 protein [Annulohypoxylon maeteangense]|uniref:glycoside hydrolase family 16 protein n=1 Tax=Annulohypoxylon maeteangense TaxID=1927788 RepID=UPI00200733BB|nr:glycoside hydrolase family 16 protein [Annulohypoxylon maeteangense]KAI0884021.1 glycoside hydrolase family 16 protein [Annulohypoxylon maeteangense]